MAIKPALSNVVIDYNNLSKYKNDSTANEMGEVAKAIFSFATNEIKERSADIKNSKVISLQNQIQKSNADFKLQRLADESIYGDDEAMRGVVRDYDGLIAEQKEWINSASFLTNSQRETLLGNVQNVGGQFVYDATVKINQAEIKTATNSTIENMTNIKLMSKSEDYSSKPEVLHSHLKDYYTSSMSLGNLEHNPAKGATLYIDGAIEMVNSSSLNQLLKGIVNNTNLSATEKETLFQGWKKEYNSDANIDEVTDLIMANAGEGVDRKIVRAKVQNNIENATATVATEVTTRSRELHSSNTTNLLELYRLDPDNETVKTALDKELAENKMNWSSQRIANAKGTEVSISENNLKNKTSKEINSHISILSINPNDKDSLAAIDNVLNDNPANLTEAELRSIRTKVDENKKVYNENIQKNYLNNLIDMKRLDPSNKELDKKIDTALNKSNAGLKTSDKQKIRANITKINSDYSRIESNTEIQARDTIFRNDPTPENLEALEAEVRNPINKLTTSQQEAVLLSAKKSVEARGDSGSTLRNAKRAFASNPTKDNEDRLVNELYKITDESLFHAEYGEYQQQIAKNSSTGNTIQKTNLNNRKRAAKAEPNAQNLKLLADEINKITDAGAFAAEEAEFNKLVKDSNNPDNYALSNDVRNYKSAYKDSGDEAHAKKWKAAIEVLPEGSLKESYKADYIKEMTATVDNKDDYKYWEKAYTDNPTQANRVKYLASINTIDNEAERSAADARYIKLTKAQEETENSSVKKIQEQLMNDRVAYDTAVAQAEKTNTANHLKSRASLNTNIQNRDGLAAYNEVNKDKQVSVQEALSINSTVINEITGGKFTSRSLAASDSYYLPTLNDNAVSDMKANNRNNLSLYNRNEITNRYMQELQNLPPAESLNYHKELVANGIILPNESALMATDIGQQVLNYYYDGKDVYPTDPISILPSTSVGNDMKETILKGTPQQRRMMEYAVQGYLMAKSGGKYNDATIRDAWEKGVDLRAFWHTILDTTKDKPVIPNKIPIDHNSLRNKNDLYYETQKGTIRMKSVEELQQMTTPHYMNYEIKSGVDTGIN